MDDKNFVPKRLLGRIDRGDKRFWGAAMFADLSSYTPYAEALCRAGTDGAERLGEKVGKALGEWAEIVRDCDGEIASFAGDAFLAYWAADGQGGVAGCRDNASRCADLLHEAGAGFGQAEESTDRSVNGMEPPPLAFHIGIGLGHLWADRLTAGERRFYLLGGAAVGYATDAARKAKPGRTEVDGRVDYSAIGDGNGDDPTGSDSRGPRRPAVDSPPTDPAPCPQAASVDVETPETETDKRFAGIVCALSVRIEGVDVHYSEPVRNALERCEEALAAALSDKRQDSINEHAHLGFEDKGLVFTLCLPVHGRADIRTTVAAALAIKRELVDRGLQCSAGVACDRGVWMPLGTSFGAVGRFLLVAARLMIEARGKVLVTSVVANYLVGDPRFRLAPLSQPLIPRNMTAYVWPQDVSPG